MTKSVFSRKMHILLLKQFHHQIIRERTILERKEVNANASHYDRERSG